MGCSRRRVQLSEHVVEALLVWLFVLALRLRDVELQLESLRRLDRQLGSAPSTHGPVSPRPTRAGHENDDSGA